MRTNMLRNERIREHDGSLRIASASSRIRQPGALAPPVKLTNAHWRAGRAWTLSSESDLEETFG